MNVALAYGSSRLSVDLPDHLTTLITPTEHHGLANERQAVLNALDQPIAALPLRDWVRPGHQVCIVFSDITRPTPNERLIPWLLEYLSFVPAAQIVLLNATGTHRPNQPLELARMLSPAVASRYRVINHDASDHSQVVKVGATSQGAPVLLNRHFVEADVRIATGFIEPHFFAGFSGGPKAIVPGIAGLETILANHSAHHLNHPLAAFGVTAGNPLWEELRDAALLAGPTFLLNVTLNPRRQITAVFAGDLLKAHHAGTEFVRVAAMQPVDAPFHVVLTTNSGYPLDLNLYQGIKGLCAGARIVSRDGLIILACECREGIPAGSPFDLFLRSAKSPRELLERLSQSAHTLPEQWQVQIQGLIQQRARTALYSSLSPELARSAHFEPCADIAQAVRQEIDRIGPNARVAVLPEGPLTIPFLREPSPKN